MTLEELDVAMIRTGHDKVMHNMIVTVEVVQLDQDRKEVALVGAASGM